MATIEYPLNNQNNVKNKGLTLMSVTSYKDNNAGFAGVEAVLIVVILAIIGGVGAYVVQQKHKADATLNTTSVSAKTIQASTSTAAGTATSIDQLTQADAQAEANIDKSADAQTQQNASNSNSAVSNVLGAYNETNL